MFSNVAIYLQFIIKSQKLPVMALAWENLQKVFVMLVVISFLYLHFTVVLHLSMFFIYIFFSTSSLTLLWTIARFLHPSCTFSPAHRRGICDTFIFNNSVIFLPWVLRFWVGIFYPQVFFTLCSFFTLWHFWNNLLLSRLLWEPAVIPWTLQGFILILKTQTQSICLFHSQ